MTIINVTRAGRAVARSGLLPDTAHFILSYLINKHRVLIKLLDSETVNETEMPDIDKLNFALIHACLDSPEFTGTQNNQTPTRFVPYQLEREIRNTLAEECEPLLARSYSLNKQRAANGAMLSLMWIKGYRPPVEIEKKFDIKLGALRDMFNSIAWILLGLSDIIADVTIENLSARSSLTHFHKDGPLRTNIRRFSRYLRRLAHRLQEGLPDEVLWMGQITDGIPELRISRSEMLTLKERGIITIQQAMDIQINPDTISMFRGVQAQRKAITFREHCRQWHLNTRGSILRRQLDRAKGCAKQYLLQELYESRGTTFEVVFEKCLTELGFSVARIDNKGVQGAPDYKISIDNRPDLIVELKSKTNGNQYIGLNEATDVLRASELHGFGSLFCLTICNPNVDPGVITTIIKCGRLCVIEMVDLAEAFLRLCQGTCTQIQFYDWVTQPGQALSADLPFKQNE